MRDRGHSPRCPLDPRRFSFKSREDFGKVVVPGHAPVAELEVRANRTGIDTGAFASGRLTCVVLDEAGHRFLAI